MPKKLASGYLKNIMEEIQSDIQMNQSVLSGTLRQTITVADTTRNLTSDESGAIIFMGGTGTTRVNLPPLSGSEMSFTFYSITATKGFVASSELAAAYAANIHGVVHSNDNSTTLSRINMTGSTAITMGSSNGLIGDVIQIRSNLSQNIWYITGLTNDDIVLEQ